MSSGNGISKGGVGSEPSIAGRNGHPALNTRGKINLIKLVKGRRCLYSYKCRYEGHDVDNKWIQVSQEMQKQGFQLSGLNCKSAWFRLLSQYKVYSRELKRSSRIARMSTGGTYNRRKMWRPPMERLNFLDELETKGCRSEKLDTDSDDDDKTEPTSSGDEDSEEVDSDYSDLGVQNPKDSADTEESCERKLGVKNKRQLDSPDPTLVKRFKEEVDVKLYKVETNDEDEFGAYGKLLATKLKKLEEGDRESFLNLQSAMNNLVYSVEIRKLGKDTTA